MQLLDQLKSRLRITWDDEDDSLKEMLKDASNYLAKLTGIPIDFVNDAQGKTLLIERCRYVYNNVADEFEKNYKHELSRLILHQAIK
ncbi:head-tail connector protein [Schinkia azotoformans]|uniref:head-tail connector protein n=1 Tax=Schinkia azotoformans TaxID=1454 RepID=UPI002DBE05EE|nr:head-tail connector protein [Schinkia azotoformans]